MLLTKNEKGSGTITVFSQPKIQAQPTQLYAAAAAAAAHSHRNQRDLRCTGARRPTTTTTTHKQSKPTDKHEGTVQLLSGHIPALTPAPLPGYPSRLHKDDQTRRQI